KRNERGRTLDVHTLRTTFGTLLSKVGVSPRTAQAAMRHSDPSLTANVYTDPKLLDVHGALDSLPNLPLDSGSSPCRERARASGTGTYDRCSVALTPNKGSQTVSTGVKTNSPDLALVEADTIAVSGFLDKKKGLVSTPDNPHLTVWAAGFEPTTSRPP